MTLNDALVNALIALDIRYVFGVSGANIELFHDAIHRLGQGKLRSIMSKSEDGAAFMADCRARVHRTLGVCCSTSGGGMMNLIAGIAESYAESVPVLALVGQPPAELEGKGAFQESSGIGRSVDSFTLFSAASKYVAKICNPDDFWHHLTEAIKAALSGRHGPAVLLFPRNIFNQEVDSCPEGWVENLRNFIRPKAVTEEMVHPLFEAIRLAHKPVVIIGHGVRRCTDQQSVTDFVHAAGLPVVTTISGRSEFPNDDPQYLGVLGVAGHPSVHTYLKEQVDLIIAVGTGLNFMTRQPLASALADKKIAVVNIDAGELTRIISPELIIEGDAGHVFQVMKKMLGEKPFKFPPIEDYRQQTYTPALAPAIKENLRHSEPGVPPLLQSEAIAMLQEFLPENGHVLYDAGNCGTAAIHMTKVPRGSSSTMALGMGGMGYAVAGAIGAQLGSPAGARTLVFAGDGAFLISGFEIHTAVDLKLPIFFVIFNNNMHGMCAMRQHLYFESRLECVSYAPLSIAQVARGFGDNDHLWIGSAGTVDELRAQLENYRQQKDIPGVLELRLTREEIPPFTPFISEFEKYAAESLCPAALINGKS
ncbi:MAG TPA: acetolactate synthase [Syntrophus sp. (in: bacteria)]|nr:acetolactate synthase [Syntrophus sp. (in: bacteria)]